MTSVRGDLVSVVLGAWLIAGLFADGWAHFNVPGLESFFTPWHGMLYAGLGASAAWMAWLARHQLRAGLAGFSGWPAGYRLGALGVAAFAVGGLADMAWHVLFGVEVGIDALLSPTHLVLLLGAGLILTSPLRSRWADRAATGIGSEWVAVGSATLTAALAAFFLMYTSAFGLIRPVEAFERLPERHPRHEATELPVVAGLAGYVITTAVLVVPLLFLVRRTRLPLGAVTVLVGVVGSLSVALIDFPGTAVAGVLGAVVGALLAELSARRLLGGGSSEPVRLGAFAAVVALGVWAGQLAGLAVVDSVRWPVALWSGVVVLSALVAGVLGLLAGRDAG